MKQRFIEKKNFYTKYGIFYITVYHIVSKIEYVLYFILFYFSLYVFINDLNSGVSIQKHNIYTYTQTRRQINFCSFRPKHKSYYFGFYRFSNRFFIVIFISLLLFRFVRKTIVDNVQRAVA